jgi:predicted AAA+ superfamily ATPase
MWERIKKPEKLTRLLQALAFQTGQEVSYHELGQIVDLDNQTVENYITLLEQTYIIFRLPPLSRNLRKELKRKRKIYFYDNGIRNAIIAQYQPFGKTGLSASGEKHCTIREYMPILSFGVLRISRK